MRLLKAALNGELGERGLLVERLIKAMDLCISCKGCKRECESNVDMARIRIEYLAQLNATIGLSLRARLLAGLPRLRSPMPWLKGLISLRNRHAWLARLGERLLGLSAQRKLPQPVAVPFRRSMEDRVGERPVVMFVDAFTHYFEPQIAEAAQEVLEAPDIR